MKKWGGAVYKVGAKKGERPCGCSTQMHYLNRSIVEYYSTHHSVMHSISSHKVNHQSFHAINLRHQIFQILFITHLKWGFMQLFLPQSRHGQIWDSDSVMTSSKNIASNTSGHFCKMCYFEIQTFFPLSTMFVCFFTQHIIIFGTFHKAVY